MSSSDGKEKSLFMGTYWELSFGALQKHLIKPSKEPRGVGGDIPVLREHLKLRREEPWGHSPRVCRSKEPKSRDGNAAV